MISANKRGPLGWVVRQYVSFKLRRQFRGIWLRGTLPPPGSRGLLVYAHHSNFWDGFVAHALSRAAGWNGYALMDEQNLARYPFLRRLGAFSLRRGDARSALESLGAARRFLHREGGAVLVFPEGEERPAGWLPLRLERGLEVLARWSHAACVPVAFRYVFFEAEYPDVLIDVGEAHGPEPIDVCARNLERVVARAFSARSLEGYRPLMVGRRGVRERWDTLRGAL